MYKALEMFTDLQDNNYKYEVGDEYPRLGLKPSLARIKELCGSDNLRGRAVIEEVEEMPFSNGAVTEKDVKVEEPKEEPKAKAETKNSTRGRGRTRK